MTQKHGRVKSILLSRGWGLTKLARHFDFSVSHIHNTISGRERPKLLQISIARLLDMSPEELWGDWLYSKPRPAGFRRRHPRREKRETKI